MTFEEWYLDTYGETVESAAYGHEMGNYTGPPDPFSIKKAWQAATLAEREKNEKAVQSAAIDVFNLQRSLSVMPSVNECVAYNEGVREGGGIVEALAAAIRKGEGSMKKKTCADCADTVCPCQGNELIPACSGFIAAKGGKG